MRILGCLAKALLAILRCFDQVALSMDTKFVAIQVPPLVSSIMESAAITFSRGGGVHGAIRMRRAWNALP
jgi:hypothetical protein